MNEKPRVVADARELSSGVPEKIAKLGVNVKTRMLGIGDYALVGDILIERKTADDFVASIFDGRLFEQASKISTVCSKPVLMVEKPLHGALQWVSNKNAVYGALAAMAFSYGFTVFQTRDSEETAQIIATVARHGRYGNLRYASPIVRGKPGGSTWQRQLAMIESIPWIGPRYAERLLRRFGGVRAVFNATQTQLAQAGIPPAAASKIQRFLNAPYVKTRTGRQVEMEEYP